MKYEQPHQIFTILTFFPYTFFSTINFSLFQFIDFFQLFFSRLFLLSFVFCFFPGIASDDEERLMINIFRGYNSLIQPVKSLNDTPIVVRLSLQLVLLINVVSSGPCTHTHTIHASRFENARIRPC